MESCDSSTPRTANRGAEPCARRSPPPARARSPGRLLGLRVRAKTGTLLREVSALSGWAWIEGRRRWAEFAILSRGLTKPQAVALEDAIVSTIASQP
jgi:D-alanyl-D-alanine carboxypeptidase